MSLVERVSKTQMLRSRLLISGMKSSLMFVRVYACNLLWGGQQRISGGERSWGSWVGWVNVGGEYNVGKLRSSGFPKMEGKVVLGEE